MKMLSKTKEIPYIAISGISLILLSIFMSIEHLYINYQIYDLFAGFSFFVCSKSPRSPILGSVGSIFQEYIPKKHKHLERKCLPQARAHAIPKLNRLHLFAPAMSTISATTSGRDPPNSPRPPSVARRPEAVDNPQRAQYRMDHCRSYRAGFHDAVIQC